MKEHVSADLARWLIRPLIAAHPLPWYLEEDWSLEVTDARGAIVLKVPYQSAAAARELVDFATKLDQEDAVAKIEVDKIMREAGLEDP